MFYIRSVEYVLIRHNTSEITRLHVWRDTCGCIMKNVFYIYYKIECVLYSFGRICSDTAQYM